MRLKNKMSDYANFFELKGQVIRSINAVEDTDEVTIATDKVIFTLFHHQSCCENVRVYRVIGDPNNIVGSEIVFAEEDSGAGDPEWWKADEWVDSYTWTRYTLRNAAGASLDIWWLGESNGYYSEDVSVSKRSVA